MAPAATAIPPAVDVETAYHGAILSTVANTPTTARPNAESSRPTRYTRAPASTRTVPTPPINRRTSTDAPAAEEIHQGPTPLTGIKASSEGNDSSGFKRTYRLRGSASSNRYKTVPGLPQWSSSAARRSMMTGSTPTEPLPSAASSLPVNSMSRIIF